MNLLGAGAMIGALQGYSEADIARLRASLGKPIASIEICDGANDECGALWIRFTDGGGPGLAIWDGGQSCCERRYLTCDDQLSDFVGALIQDIELSPMPEIEEDGEPHEQMALKITTTLGAFTVVTHNEHNGYYGGFWLQWGDLG